MATVNEISVDKIDCKKVTPRIRDKRESIMMLKLLISKKSLNKNMKGVIHNRI